jgi:chromosome segregation ATPase
VEAYYTSQLKDKKEELSEYDMKVLGLDEKKEIDREIARLDSSYFQLKKQLLTTPNTEKVMNAMIQNLQIRIEVLNRQLEVLQKIDRLQKQPTTEEPLSDETNV